jgi:ABC-type branched-subunit amino acid transport system substrate-binding protein
MLSFSQTAKDYERKYESGKQLLKQGKYDLAREVFSSLTQGTPYAAYAHYYQAYALFKTKKLDNARLHLIQALEKYPSWPDAEAGHYLLANIAFEKEDPSAAISYLEKIKSKQMRADAQHLKEHYLPEVKEIGVLRNLQKKYPEDATIASALVDRLLASSRPEDIALARQLDSKFKLGKMKEIEELKSISKKDAYNVAVLFPFQQETLEPGKPRNNQFVLDMYAGMKIAQEDLNAQGIKLNILAYDVASDANKMQEMVSLPEFSSMDLIIGPLYGPTNKVAVTFANQRNIGLINPISNNAQLIENNPSAYLLKPSQETQVQRAAEYALNSFSPKSATIFYGSTPKDSILAFTYQKHILAKGGKINAMQKVTQTNVGQLTQAITNLDEKSLGHIFISTDNQNVVVNFINSLEKRFSKLPIITMSNWLELKMVSFEQLERRNVHFIHPDFIDYGSETVRTFRKNYLAKRNIIPSIYSYQGYDMMMFFGKLLGEHGTYFHQALHQQPIKQGVVLSAYNYTGSNDNQYVPLVKFENARLVLVNPVQ